MRQFRGLILALGLGLASATPADAQYYGSRGPYLGGTYYQAPTYAYRYSNYPGLTGMGLYTRGAPGFNYGSTYGPASFAQPGYLGYTTYAAPTTRTYSAGYNGYVAPNTGRATYASPWYGTTYYYPYTSAYSYPRYDYSAFNGWPAGTRYRGMNYGYGGYGGWYR